MKTIRNTVVITLVSCLAAMARGEVVIVKDGSSEHEIVRSADAVRAVRLAADELHRFIKHATGVALPIVETATPGKGHIFVGPNPASAAAGITPDDLKPEGFRLKVVGRDIHIMGSDTDGNPKNIRLNAGTQCGTLNGAYELLERCVGVVFAWHDDLGTVVPERQQIVVPALDVTDAPDWSYRALAYSPSGEMNKLFGRRLRLGHPYSVSHSHAWFRILPAEEYGKEHPEYFAELKGKRRPEYYLGHHGGQVCTTNPEVIKIFADAAIDYFNKLPHRDMFSVSPNDGGGFCQCAACRALDSGETCAPERPDMPVLTDRVLTFYNAIAERMVKVHPDKLLGAYIYSYYKRPPRKVRPHPNLALVNATNSAHTHGLNWETEHQWEREWRAVTKHLFKYDIYYYGRCALNLMAPVTTHLIEKIRAEHDVGIEGGYLYMGQSYEQLGAGHYLLAKLMWDKDADARALERRYYDALYGPAGPDVMAYYRLLEERLRKVYLEEVDVEEPMVQLLLKHKPAGGSPGRILAAYWPILGQATSLIKGAQARELSDSERRRLVRLVDQHELLVATVRGMIAAGRLEHQTQFDAADVAMLRAALQQREAAKTRIKAYAPTLFEYLDKGDHEETARISRAGAFYRLALTERLPELLAVRAETAPHIDGLGDDAVWRQAPFEHLLLAKSAAYPRLGARAAAAFDDEYLYFFIEGREGDTSKLSRATKNRDDVALFGDDNVELFLQPPDGKAYYHVALGAGGALYDACHPTGIAEESNQSWDSRARVGIHVAVAGWSAEIAVPFDSLGATQGDTREWRINVCRTRRGVAEPDEYTAVAPTFGGYHIPAKFSRLRFVEAARAPLFTHGTIEDIPPEDVAQLLRFHGEGGATAALSEDCAYCGKRAVRISVPAGGFGAITLSANVKAEKGYRVLIAHLNHDVVLKPGVRADAPTCRIIFRNEAGKSVTPTTGYSWFGASALEKSDQWCVMPHVFSTPPGTAKISLTFFFHHKGDYWVDDVRLQEF